MAWTERLHFNTEPVPIMRRETLKADLNRRLSRVVSFGVETHMLHSRKLAGTSKQKSARLPIPMTIKEIRENKFATGQQKLALTPTRIPATLFRKSWRDPERRLHSSRQFVASNRVGINSAIKFQTKQLFYFLMKKMHSNF